MGWGSFPLICTRMGLVTLEGQTLQPTAKECRCCFGSHLLLCTKPGVPHLEAKALLSHPS